MYGITIIETEKIKGKKIKLQDNKLKQGQLHSKL